MVRRDDSAADDKGPARYSQDNGIRSTGPMPCKNGAQPRRPKPRFGGAATNGRRQRMGPFHAGLVQACALSAP